MTTVSLPLLVAIGCPRVKSIGDRDGISIPIDAPFAGSESRDEESSRNDLSCPRRRAISWVEDEVIAGGQEWKAQQGNDEEEARPGKRAWPG